MTHAELVERAERWLLKTCGCGFAFAELCAATNTGEIPDAIGWKSGISILVECKSTRSDFLADKRKRFRKQPDQGMGKYRYYLTVPGMINPEDLPESWGLLYCHPKKIERVVSPVKGNIFSPGVFVANESAEIQLMASALRRIHLRGLLPRIYDDSVLHIKGNENDNT